MLWNCVEAVAQPSGNGEASMPSSGGDVSSLFDDAPRPSPLGVVPPLGVPPLGAPPQVAPPHVAPPGVSLPFGAPPSGSAPASAVPQGQASWSG